MQPGSFRARIEPRPLAGAVPAIASKSMAHRLIIAAALADGDTQVACDTTCADIEATRRCLEALGARVEPTAHGFAVRPVPRDADGRPRAHADARLDCGESGSTLRFMLPVACALGRGAVFTGAGRLGARPLSPLSDELIAGGCDLEGLGGFPLRASGELRPGRFELPGDVSSQYVSGLLLAAPMLGRASEVLVRGRLESRPYVDLTVRALRAFGVEVAQERRADGSETLFSVAGDAYRTPGAVRVEGDWSNAAFWLCAGALGREPVTVRGLDLASPQGDRSVLAALSLFGARILRGADAVTVRPDRLQAVDISARDIPDLVPVLAAVASCAEGASRIRDCARLRIKESDRLATTTAELAALGARIEVDGDDLVIEGAPALAGGTVSSHNDHRIAMMASVAAVRCEGPVTIEGAEAVRKSYPAFFDHYGLLGGRVLTEPAATR